jgi:hypothetical protein
MKAFIFVNLISLLLKLNLFCHGLIYNLHFDIFFRI